MKVAFWNLQRLGLSSSEAKVDAIANWLASYQPDLFAVCEVNLDGLKRIHATKKYLGVGYVNTLDCNLKETGLCVGVMVRNGGALAEKDLSARVVRLANGDQRRAILVATVQQSYRILVLHANASRSGGEHAVMAARNILTKFPTDVAIGDFNYDLNRESLAKINSFLSPAEAVPPLQLTKTQKSGGLLDFLIKGAKRKATAEQSWDSKIDAKKSDHWPVMFTIE